MAFLTSKYKRLEPNTKSNRDELVRVAKDVGFTMYDYVEFPEQFPAITVEYPYLVINSTFVNRCDDTSTFETISLNEAITGLYQFKKDKLNECI